MRILYDDQVFAMQAYGGISRYFTEIIWRMAEHEGHEVLAFEGWSENRYHLSQHRSAFAAYAGLPRPSLRGATAICAKLSGLWFRAWVRNRPVDVYHPTYYGRAALDVRTRARVVTVYDMIHELFPEHFDDPVTTPMKRAAVARADAIIAISEHTKRDLVRLFGVAPERVTVIPLGSSLAAAPARPVPLPPRYVLFVGTRAIYKNFPRTLAAFAKAQRDPDVALLCAGGPPFSRGEHSEIAALGLQGRVIHRSMDDAQLRFAYEHALCFLYPSLYEGFGIPPLEAMSLGCPTVVSNRASLPEVIGDAALSVDPENVTALAEAVSELLGSAQARGDYAQRGKARAARFSWDRCANETARLYASLP